MIRVFRQQKDGRWGEVEGTEKKRVLEKNVDRPV
jgi:hypothetical protein